MADLELGITATHFGFVSLCEKRMHLVRDCESKWVGTNTLWPPPGGLGAYNL